MAMQPSVSYIPYTTLSHEQTGYIITFAQFEEENLVENKHNIAEGKSILPSINESYIYDESDEGSMSSNFLEEIWDGSQIHQDINARDNRFKILNHIKQTQFEWKGEELS